MTIKFVNRNFGNAFFIVFTTSGFYVNNCVNSLFIKLIYFLINLTRIIQYKVYYIKKISLKSNHFIEFILDFKRHNEILLHNSGLNILTE